MTTGAAFVRRAPAAFARPDQFIRAIPPDDFDPSSRLFAAFAVLGLTLLTSTAPGRAQAPALGTLAGFAILAGSGITNTGNSVITGTPGFPGDLGSSTATIGGFPPGNVVLPGIIHLINDGPTITAQNALTTAYNNLMGRPATLDLTGQDLGGKTLTPGVYNFSSFAQLTGTLTLNGLGNPNSVFIFNITSTLTTANASTVSLVSGAQGGNVFWRVGSSATLGTTTSFAGDILAQASITLDTGASINCGAAWARTGAVTLDTNAITICPLLATAGPALGPTGIPLLSALLPSSATADERAVANALDAFIGGGGILPLSFLNLFILSPADLANALAQLSGQAATGAQQSGFQMMGSFLSRLTNPFADNRAFAPQPPPRPLVYKAPVYKALGASDARRWSIWGAAYGSAGANDGDPDVTGSVKVTTRSGGFATGLDYLVAPDTAVGFALAGGDSSWSLAAGLGGGHADVLQAGLYAVHRDGPAYLSAAIAYASYWASTSRTVTFAGNDTLDAAYNAQNFGGRLEAGYRIGARTSLGIIPYGAVQAQRFFMPGYAESGSLGVPDPFGLAYEAQAATAVRGELGSRFDQLIAETRDSSVTLIGRVAWARNWQSDPDLTATFIGLPGATFVVAGAAAPKNLALVTAGAEWGWRNGWSLMAKFDGELARGYDTYMGTARVRYLW
jgi:outer membrane autotransporter protein